MRQSLIATMAAVSVMFAAAEAAPAFGAGLHRAGGAERGHAKESPLAAFEALLALIGIEATASVRPVTETGERTKTKQCEQSKKTEIAKAAPKADADGGAASKGRSRTGEPVYLAF